MNKKQYRLLKADLLGNDDDGYEWNDSYDCGTYEIDESIIVGTDKEFIQALVKEGVFDAQALKASVEIDIQSDGIDETFYIDFTFSQNAPRSRESYELRPINN